MVFSAPAGIIEPADLFHNHQIGGMETMRINVTFRHMETSEPVRNYVEEKLPKVKKYIDEPVEAQVVLSVEKKSATRLKFH